MCSKDGLGTVEEGSVPLWRNEPRFPGPSHAPIIYDASAVTMWGHCSVPCEGPIIPGVLMRLFSRILVA